MRIDSNFLDFAGLIINNNNSIMNSIIYKYPRHPSFPALFFQTHLETIEWRFVFVFVLFFGN